MGLFGFPYSVPFGGHQEFIDQVTVTNLGSGILVDFKPHTGYEQYYRLMVDGIAFGQPVYADTTSTTQLTGLFSATGTNHVWSICPQGDWATDQVDISPQQIAWQAGRNDRLHIVTNTKPRIFSYDDSGQLTSWVLTGVRRFVNCKPVQRRPTWGQITVTIEDNAGTRTVTLLMDETEIASGSRVGNGTVTLVEQNDSGVSGTVAIVYTGDITDGTVVCAFPEALKFHYRTAAFAAPDFPRTAEGTVDDDGQSNRFTHISASLTAGSYNVLAHQRDELGNESAGLTAQTVTVVSIPPVPGTPVYASGGAAATVINFAACSDATATYNIYDSKDTGIFDVETVSATHIAGTGTLSQTLAAISGTFTGIRQVLIRSLKGGVESGNMDVLQIEYLVGVVIKARPPVPGVAGKLTTSGLTITVPVIINTTGQAIAATQIRLYVYAANGGAPVYGTPQGTATPGTAVTGIINTNVSYTVGAPGAYKFEVRTYSSVSTTESANVKVYGPINLTTAAPDDPSSFTAYAGL